MGVVIIEVALPTGVLDHVAQAPVVLEGQAGVADAVAAQAGLAGRIEEHGWVGVAMRVVAVGATLAGEGLGGVDQ